MKDSGIPWIGEIPNGWSVNRLKQESTFINGFAFDSEDFKIDEGVRVIRIGDIGLKADFENCVRAITNPSILTPYRIENGDILIAMSGATTGKCCIVDEVEEAYINQRVGIIRSDIRKIIYYSLQTPYFMEFVNLNNAGSAQPNISSKAIGEFPIIVMPKEEQQRIVAFLDRKCAEVDEMIGLQEQIIEELKAYKQSVITETVTKGLNPAAPMRDSGIEWIGQIPEHWEVKRLKFIAERHNQKVSDEVLPYIGLENVESFSERFIETENEYDITQAQVCAVGDVIFGKLRPYLGKAMVIKKEHCCSSEFLVLSGSGAPSYLRYLMLSDWFVEIVNASTYGTKMPRANADYIMNMQVVCPSIEERKAIADYLDEKCADIDSLIQTKQSKIDSLKEYKKSIIYEYVTGKREVELV